MADIAMKLRQYVKEIYNLVGDRYRIFVMMTTSWSMIKRGLYVNFFGKIAIRVDSESLSQTHIQ